MGCRLSGYICSLRYGNIGVCRIFPLLYLAVVVRTIEHRHSLYVLTSRCRQGQVPEVDNEAPEVGKHRVRDCPRLELLLEGLRLIVPSTLLSHIISHMWPSPILQHFT